MEYQILTGIYLILLALMSYYLFRMLEHQETSLSLPFLPSLNPFQKKSQEQLGVEGIVSAVIKGDKKCKKEKR